MAKVSEGQSNNTELNSHVIEQGAKIEELKGILSNSDKECKNLKEQLKKVEDARVALQAVLDEIKTANGAIGEIASGAAAGWADTAVTVISAFFGGVVGSVAGVVGAGAGAAAGAALGSKAMNKITPLLSKTGMALLAQVKNNVSEIGKALGVGTVKANPAILDALMDPTTGPMWEPYELM
jgi:chromosome segregation ATPase